MDNKNLAPLKRLHSLQEQENERYQSYKEKYTKELLAVDIPKDKRELLIEGIDAMARANSVSDYVKLKFEGLLSPTDRFLWKSLFKFVHDYNISLGDFNSIIELYYMPLPVNIEIGDAFTKLKEHRWVKLQDDKGKSLYGPYEEMSSELDFSLIRYLQLQDSLFQELRRYFDKEPLNTSIAKLGARLRGNLILTNCSFYQFFIKLFLQETGNIPEEVRTFCNPDSVTFYHSEVFMSSIAAATFYVSRSQDESPINTQYLQDGLYSSVKIMQGYCAFVSFCSSLLIATLSDEKYRDSLLDMMCFFLRHFQNACIFRIEIPDSPLNERKGIEERGSKDHTTRMKIYLYDSKRVPYVVRVDMPHKGDEDENRLHFNVDNLYDNSVLDHTVIDCHNSNPTDLLHVLIDNMRRMTPAILETKDSYKEDDKRMLEIMKGFNAYNDLCMAYFLGEDNQAAIYEFNASINCTCKTVEEGIQEGFLYFSTL